MSGKSIPQSIINALIAGIVGRSAAMIKVEVNRAKQEFASKLKGLGVGVGLVAWSLSMLAFGVMLLFVAGLIALTSIWPAWLVALAGGGFVVVFGLIVLAVGQSKIKKNKDLKPDEAITNIRAMFGA